MDTELAWTQGWHGHWTQTWHSHSVGIDNELAWTHEQYAYSLHGRSCHAQEFDAKKQFDRQTVQPVA